MLYGFDEWDAGAALTTAWDVIVSILSRAILPALPTYALTYIHKVNVRQAKRQQETYFCCSTALFHAAVVLVECSVYDICPSCWTWIHSTSCTCTDDRLACIMPHSIHCTAQHSTTLLYTLYCSISQSSSLGDNTSLLVICHLASSLATACLINHHAQTAQSLQQSGKTNEYMLEHIWASRYFHSGMHSHGCIR